GRFGAFFVEGIEPHTRLQKLFNSRPLAGLNCKRNCTVGLHYFAELLPPQSRMFDLEVFDHFASGVDYDNTMFLTGPIQSTKTTLLQPTTWSLLRAVHCCTLCFLHF